LAAIRNANIEWGRVVSRPTSVCGTWVAGHRWSKLVPQAMGIPLAVWQHYLGVKAYSFELLFGTAAGLEQTADERTRI